MDAFRAETRLFRLALMLVLAMVAYSYASEFEIIKGNGCYRYGDNETPMIAESTALKLAKQRAIEGYKVFVASTTRMENLELKSDIITSLSAASLHDLKITDKRETGREICVWIEAKLDPDDVRGTIDNKSLSRSLGLSTSDFTEKVRDGVIDWDKKVVRAKGFGGANKSFPSHVWKKSAEEAAKVDALTKLLEMVNGLTIESKTFVKNYQVSLDEKVKEVRGKVKDARQVGRTNYPTDDTAEVIMELRLD